jgi:hypothetical protein
VGGRRCFRALPFRHHREPVAGFTRVNHAVQVLPLIPAGWISWLLLALGWLGMEARGLAREAANGGV